MTASPTAPADRARDWLARLGAALTRGDIEAATALFGPRCFWRDMVAFTWNIRTFEGRDQIAAMLAATLARTAPRGFALAGPASESDGVVEALIEFETAIGRGRGHLRLADGMGFTLLTTLGEIKGHEEKRGRTRENGVAHGIERGRRTWLERREDEARELGATRQPYCVIVGGGQGGMAPGRADDHPGDASAAGRRLATALQVALPARPGLVRPHAVHPVPGPLAGLLAEGPAGRLAGDVRQGHGAECLDLGHLHPRALRRGRRRMACRRRSRRHAGDPAPEASGAGDGHGGGAADA
jgi:ketosteroid isomerase-like protein